MNRRIKSGSITVDILSMNKLFIFITILIFNLEANPSITSTYTDFSRDCKNDPKISDGDIPRICKGPNDYSIYISYSACFEVLQIMKKEKFLNISIPQQPIGSSEKRKLEWRLVDGQAKGFIYRVHEMIEDPNGSCPQRKNKEVLEIRTLSTEQREESIPSGNKANEKAREILDKLITSKQN